MRQLPILIAIISLLIADASTAGENASTVQLAALRNHASLDEASSDEAPPIYTVDSVDSHDVVIERENADESDAGTAYEKCRNLLRHSMAGFPQCVKSNARCTYDHRYRAYYVGGSTPFSRRGCLGGEGRYPDEGTFGVDYAPWYSKVNLGWSHGVLFQDGTGSYETDRLNLPFGLRLGKRVTTVSK